MRILLDTHCWLWMTMAPVRFGTHAFDLISNPDNRLFLSAVSTWEIAVKHRLGRLELPLDPERYVLSRMEATGVEGLSLAPVHGLRAGVLPPHHDDPFDRLLVAQAQLEDLPLLTADRDFERYEVEVIWADGGASGREWR